MPTGSVDHQNKTEEKEKEILQDNLQQPPALPNTEPPQLDTDAENVCNKKILLVDHSNLIEEATRELDENGNELPKQICPAEQVNCQSPPPQSSNTPKTNYLIRLLSILRHQFRSKRASYELQSSDEPPCGAGLRFWNRGKQNSASCNNDYRRREEAFFSSINNEPGTNVQIRYRTTDSL